MRSTHLLHLFASWAIHLNLLSDWHRLCFLWSTKCFYLVIRVKHYHDDVIKWVYEDLSYMPWSWWRLEMETFSELLALCEGNSPATGGFPSHRPVTWSCDVFFGLRLIKRLSNQSRRRWFEMPSCSLLWRYCDAEFGILIIAYCRYAIKVKVHYIIHKWFTATLRRATRVYKVEWYITQYMIFKY